jgi:putative transposase
MTSAGLTPFYRNEVLIREDGTRHRLLRLDITPIRDDLTGQTEVVGTAWLILLGAPQALPRPVPIEQLHQQYRRQEREEEPARPAKSELFVTALQALPKPPSAASIRLSERAYARIEPLVGNPDIFEPSSRHALLVARSKEPGTGTPKTLLKDLRNWWQGGQTQDALLGSYSNCARPTMVGTAGRGRRKVKGLEASPFESEDSLDDGLEGQDHSDKRSRAPYQLTQEDYDHMRDVIETFFFDKKVRRVLTKTLQELHERYYTYEDGNGVKCLLPAHECPSYKQLHYFLHSNYPTETIERARKGDKRFAQEDRSTEGSIQLECHGVGHIYEFDATILDLPLVSSKSRTDIVGKPTLYLIIDRHSRFIVGWYMGFESANYSAAMQAILSIGEDKEALCRELGLPYDPEDWPAHGVLPEMFLADQGELMHKKARRIARSIRSTISNVPGLRPDWKPLVECGFAMIHQVIAPHAPGHTPDSETRQRRSVNRDRDIAMNLQEARKLVLSAIIAHNQSPQLGYPLTFEQAEDGVRPIPRELWNHSVLRRMGQLDKMDYKKARAELMPRAQAVVSEDGILFERMYYSCPEAKARGWLVDGRRRRQPLEIAFDYRLVDEVIVYSPDQKGESFVAKLTGDSVKFSGMSLKEVERHFRRVNALSAGSAEEKRQALFEHRSRTKPTTDHAVKEVKEATVGVSRSGRRADTAEARQAELRRERVRSAGVQPPPASATAPTSAPVAPARDVGAPVPPSTTTKAKVIQLQRGASSGDARKTDAPPAATTAEDTTLSQRLATLRRNLLS